MRRLTECGWGGSYEALLAFIRKVEVLRVAKACLQRVHLSTSSRHRVASDASAPERVNTRMFLAGYLVAYHSDKVFEQMGPLETALREAAVTVLARFQRIIDAVSEQRYISEVSGALTKDFPTMLYTFLRRFQV